MYDAHSIAHLAEDAEFVARVRQFARRLLASGAIPAERVSDIAGLTTFGPSRSGSVIRLVNLPHLVAIPANLLPEWADLAAHLDEAEVGQG